MPYRVYRYTDDIIARKEGANAGDICIQKLVDGEWKTVEGEGPWPSYLKSTADDRREALNEAEEKEGIPDLFEGLE